MKLFHEKTIDKIIMELICLFEISGRDQRNLKAYLGKINCGDIITINHMKKGTGILDHGMCGHILMHLCDLEVIEKIFIHKCISCGKEYIYKSIRDEKVSVCEECSSAVKPLNFHGLAFSAQ